MMMMCWRVTWLGLGFRRGESRRPSAPPSHTGTDDGHMPSSLPMCDGGVPHPLAEFLTSCPPVLHPFKTQASAVASGSCRSHKLFTPLIAVSRPYRFLELLRPHAR